MEDEHSVSMYASSKDAEIARLREALKLAARRFELISAHGFKEINGVSPFVAWQEIKEALRGEAE